MLIPLRPSSEHILIVRAPGARDQHGSHSTPFIVGALRARRAPGRSSLILPAAEFLAASIALASASQNVDADVSCASCS